MNEDLFSSDQPAARVRMNGKPVFEAEARSVLNLESGFRHKLLCDGPTFSTGSACAYSCTFCFVEDLMKVNPHWIAVRDSQPAGMAFPEIVIRRRNAIGVLRKQLTFAGGRPRFMGDDQEGMVVYASPLVDCAANMELVRETVEACRLILSLTRWTIRLLSKSNLLPKVAESLGDQARGRVIYGVSTGTLDDRLAAAFEKGTALVSKRINSLHWLQDRGFRTFGMICPSLPQVAYQTFASQMAEALRADRCEHVWGEVINVRGESMTRTVAALAGAGFGDEAEALEYVSTNPEAWEEYARATFRAEARVIGADKLRFLQYVTAASRPWWAAQTKKGAVLL